ncbi:zinc finger Y-chromosomal protein 1-like isoform X2 [Phymastichus coffea]|uniref:zinc finger Y-chromosomal protein 1-like isoform X2 n=1 Tax=Phymastichus coffea TaxID=108790 RepID=UPI00273C6198|nr:zinc finger Y-chromosomal protein 1-like isoform X2 [Phymastichus coffea]
MLNCISLGKPVKELLRLKIINSNGLYRSSNQLENFTGPSLTTVPTLNNNNTKNNKVKDKDADYINLEQNQKLAEIEMIMKDEYDDSPQNSFDFILPDYPKVYEDVDQSSPTFDSTNYTYKNSSTPTAKFYLILLYCQHCNCTFKKQHNVKQNECERCERALQYQCVNCDKRYNHQRSAISHVKLECRNRLGFGCVLCDFRTNHRKGLVAHIENAHAAYDPNKAVSCDQCKKVYKNYKNLRKHQLIDCGKMPTLQCDHCHYKSNYKSRIREHIKCRHMLEFHEFHKCSKCGKRYKTTSYFRKHEAFLCKKIANVA